MEDSRAVGTEAFRLPHTGQLVSVRLLNRGIGLPPLVVNNVAILFTSRVLFTARD